MAFALKSSVALPKRAGARAASRQVLRAPARKLVIRASAEPSTPASNEALEKIQSTANEAWTWVKDKWATTEDSEKPAVVGIIAGVIVAQIAIGATIDVVDRIPIVNKLLQLVGLAVTAVFIYKITTDPEERTTVKSSITGFLKEVTGDDK
ncbi:hypothetical protein CHLRE_12g550702v5 [Chlamydomonas reinhardtii]|uniref:Cyanobacterial aminoacyl-tRNA synthetase CAAD domain-containing protein n=1 Tax=Chlamydomonas reinhardtii TaxID=3055 RepID=A8JHG4_CHLRE|nr:uncharacterized protein CHLRE_12g550702v5 [Chlamydomonas reinhardtii]PNW76342.1 hypothetical protein CHLRE_12g550702v5 [Chlamydomonas reinhardtii]|eukprot:XP_001703033.1 predicted protein [Chlamydomonas reinhardtii]